MYNNGMLTNHMKKVIKKEGYLVLSDIKHDQKYCIEIRHVGSPKDEAESFFYDGTFDGFIQALEEEAENMDPASMWNGGGIVDLLIETEVRKCRLEDLASRLSGYLDLFAPVSR